MLRQPEVIRSKVMISLEKFNFHVFNNAVKKMYRDRTQESLYFDTRDKRCCRVENRKCSLDPLPGASETVQRNTIFDVFGFANGTFMAKKVKLSSENVSHTFQLCVINILRGDLNSSKIIVTDLQECHFTT